MRVAGFDIAGAEAGFPPTRHLDAFEYLRRENAHFTIHAGEAFGLPSIWEALSGAARTGSATGCGSSTTSRSRRRRHRRSWAGSPPTSGTSGSRWRCARRRTCRPVPRPSIAEHPIGLLAALKFRVTVNTDNRLMSGCSMTSEMTALARGFRLRLGRAAVVHGQRDEVVVPPVRRAAGADRRGDQAGIRRIDGVRGFPPQWCPAPSAADRRRWRRWLRPTCVRCRSPLTPDGQFCGACGTPAAGAGPGDP